MASEAKRKRTRSTKLNKTEFMELRHTKRGRPRKNEKQVVEETAAEDTEDLPFLYAELSEDEVAQCVPNGLKSIECFVCGAQMSKIYKLREHMLLHEQLESYDEKCLEKSAIYETLNPHRRNIETSVIRDFIIKEIKEKRYSQFYGILTEAGIELHHSDSETESETEANREIESEKLEEKSNISTENNKHARRNQKIPQNTYKCDICQITFVRRYKALFHQKTTHSNLNLRIECEFCGRRFMGVQLLIHHLKTKCESDEHPISCVERFRQYLLKVNLEQFDCLAEARKELKMHRLTTAEKLYSCNICQKKFLRSEHLTRHRAVHLPDELKVECPVCFKKFNRKDNLRTHMKVHMNEAERDVSNDQSILCQYCGHCFTSKSNYVVHMRRHTGEKPYQCDVCGKGFPKSTDLNSHKITHTGERNFVCKICDKAFARSSVLSKHMRVHLGPFHCSYCDQSFSRPNELANHLRCHANEFKCNDCNRKFGTKSQLDAHLLAASHKISDESNCIPVDNTTSAIIERVASQQKQSEQQILLPLPCSDSMVQNSLAQDIVSSSGIGGGDNNIMPSSYLSVEPTQPPEPPTLTDQSVTSNNYQNWQ